MASVEFSLLLSTLLVQSMAQEFCDPLTRQCINGVCELQTNQQLACTCNPGFIPDFMNPLLCSHFDECQFLYTGCAAGTCINFPGSYYCTSCIQGYTLNQFNRCQIINPTGVIPTTSPNNVQ